jgi:hypothetical protein
MVGIGKPEVGDTLVKHLELQDAESIVHSDPENALHDALDLNFGLIKTFFNPATPLALAGRLFNAEDGMEELKEVLGKWKDAFYIPPKREQAFNMGGTFVFKGDSTVFAHLDSSPGDHANTQRVINIAVDATT